MILIVLTDGYDELLEDLDDPAVLLERRSEPTIPVEEVIRELRNKGLLSPPTGYSEQHKLIYSNNDFSC